MVNKIARLNFSARFNCALKLRGYSDYSYRELSGLFEISHSLIYDWKNNNKLPSIDVAFRVSKILNVSFEWFCTGNGKLEKCNLCKYKKRKM